MITKITETVLAQEAQEEDSIKMLSKKLDRLMDPIFINGILNIIKYYSYKVCKPSVDTGKYKQHGLN